MDYISNRNIIVKVDKVYSKTEVLKYGVPQGSILGPLVYLLYVNNMSDVIKNSKIYMYADDTVLVTSDKSVELAEKKLQEDFLYLTKWCHDNGLKINEKKSKIMHIHSPFFTCRNPQIKAHSHNCLHLETHKGDKCQCRCLDNVCSFKYLGIIVDHNFKWDVHVREVTKKLRVCAAKFYYLRQYLPYNTMKLLYSSMCESIIRYGLKAWGSAAHTTMLQVQTAQTRLLKIIAKLDGAIVGANPICCFEITNTLSVEKLFKFLLIID